MKIRPQEEKDKAGSITLFDFKLYDKVIIIKIAWFWQGKQIHKSMDQNRERQITHTYVDNNLCQRTCSKGERILSINDIRKTALSTCKRKKERNQPLSHTIHNNQLKMF